MNSIAQSNHVATSPLQLLIAEPFHPFLHGITANSTPGIDTHMLVYETFEPNDLFSGEARETVDFLNDSYDSLSSIPPHPVFQNYPRMIGANGMAEFQLTIGSVIELPGREQVVIDKSRGLKRLQRRVRARMGASRTTA